MKAGPEALDWIREWIQGQRRILQQWSPGDAAPAADPAAFMQALKAVFAAGVPGVEGAGSQLFDLWRTLIPGTDGKVPGELPAIGPLGQQLGELHAFNAAAGEYQRLAAEWAASLAQVHQNALDLLSRRTAELENAGKPPRSARELYDLWVECGEEVYARVAHGETHSRLVADLGNAGIRFMEARQVLLERWLRQLDLPTRSEVNSLNLRIRNMERELERLRVPVGTAKCAQARKAPARASTGAKASTPRRAQPRTPRRK